MSRGGKRRRQLAVQVARDVASSIEQGEPWTIAPPDTHQALKRFVAAFASEFATRRIGLTDVQVVETARELRRKYHAKAAYRVHIWTRDQQLKALEPDKEPDAFV